MTNGDRIRQMTDEELIKMVAAGGRSMNDYKELIYALKSCQHIASNCIDCPLSNTKYYNPKTKECEVHLHNVAADVIEQLVKERDAAVEDLTFSYKHGLSCFACKHDFAVDAAEYCIDCKFNSNFEWRGVEVNDG